MTDVASTAAPDAAPKKSRGANPNVDYKTLFQKIKDKYDRVSSDHTDLVANISRATAKQVKLREELDWMLDTFAARRAKVSAAREKAQRWAAQDAAAMARREQQQTEAYYQRDPYHADARAHAAAAAPSYGSYDRSYPPTAAASGPPVIAYNARRYRSPSPQPYYHPPPPVRTVQDPYDHIPPPPLQAQEAYYRPAYSSSRHIVDPYRPRSASRSPPPPSRTYAHSPTLGDQASAKRPRPPSTDPLDPRHDRWAPEAKRPRND